MRNTTLAILAASLCSSVLAAPSLPSCFLGRWRSDEAMTLADMRRHEEVTPKARALFEEQFFGKLVLVFGSKLSGAYLEPYQERKDIVFVPVDVVSATDRSAVLRSSTLGIIQENEFHCEDGRLWVHVSRWKFREYFSPE